MYSIAQDAQGFLYLGTGDGFARYDGCTLTPLRRPVADGRASAPTIIRSYMQPAGGGRVLFATVGSGLCMLHASTNSITRVHTGLGWIDRSRHVQLLGAAPDGAHLWALIGDTLVGVPLYSSAPLRLGPLKPWIVVDSAGAIPAPRPAVVTRDAVYIGAPGGIVRYDVRSGRVQLALGNTGGGAICSLPGGSLAIAGPGSLLLWDGQPGSIPRTVPVLDSDGKPISLGTMVEHRGIIWAVTSARGLARIDLRLARSGAATSAVNLIRADRGSPYSLPTDYLATLFIDRSENLWIGTEGGGLCKLDLKPPLFRSFPGNAENAARATGLMVKSILPLTDGRILTGTFDDGLVVRERDGTTRTVRFPGVEAPAGLRSINLLRPDARGRVWMNVASTIGLLDTATLRFKPVASLPPVGNAGNYAAYAFCETGQDTFLLGTDRGLCRMVAPPNGRVRIATIRGVPSGHYYGLLPGEDGSVHTGRLVGGYARIRLIPGSDSAVVEASGFGGTGIRHFYASPGRPVLWMASEEGLIAMHLRSGRAVIIGEGAGLPNGHLYAVLPEHDTALWVSSNRGLACMAFRWGTSGLPTAIRIRGYGVEAGLQSAEFNSGAHFAAKDGTLYFGGITGINWFHPQYDIHPNPYPAPVVITGISVNEKPLLGWAPGGNPSADLRLPYKQNTVAVTVAALEYTAPAGTLYAYKLEGLDKGWSPPRPVPEVRYAGLPPGRYTLRIRAAPAGGVWRTESTDFSFRILPPPWATPWARGAMGAVILAALSFGIRWYVQRSVRQRLRELEKQRAVNDERLRIAKDMHDELGSGLTKIALLSEVASRQAPISAKTQSISNPKHTNTPTLSEIIRTARGLTEKMGEIIWTLNPSADTLDNLAAYIHEYLSETAEALDRRILTDIPYPVPSLVLTHRQRHEILLVTKEAVNNAIKHAGEEAVIRFSLRVEEKRVHFAVADDGRGFQTTDSGGIAGKRNGLGNMCSRMEGIGGWCRMVSAIGSGTRVEFGI